MTYASLQECCLDLEKHNMLIRLQEPLDPDQVIPELHRRVYAAQGPALYYENIVGTKFKAVSNIFGTNHRSEFIFRAVLKKLEWLFTLKADPAGIIKKPFSNLAKLPFLISSLPKKLSGNALTHQCKISELPQIKSWPKDGGSFITLPQVISFPPHSMSPKNANVGMYRIQLSGNDYHRDKEIGLHYQIHRGIGIHHVAFLKSDADFKLSIAVGGPPAYTLASIFPLPEGLSEILFSGLLNNRRYRYAIQNGYFIPQDVDFCITGIVNKTQLKKEGPFGDHLGYYSLAHDFPIMENIQVMHKKNALWHFTVVGRPPQEDSGFGHLIHEMVRNITGNEFPGIKQIHAVDAAGVHPLLLAVGSERYMPFRERKPEEILTMANHLLGKGQTSLTKYLFIAAEEAGTNLDVKNVRAFFNYILERIDWRYDLHFQTNTTIDTLDYSGESLNAGSKLVIACNRNMRRKLEQDNLILNHLPPGFSNSQKIQNGLFVIKGRPFTSYTQTIQEMELLCSFLDQEKYRNIPLIIVCDDTDFLTADYKNFLWVSFTRSNPSHDIYGVNSSINFKHWSCGATMVIDARIKPHHAPILETDPDVSRKVDDIVYRNPLLKKILS